MNRIFSTFFIWFAGSLFLLSTTHAADDITSILNKIESNKSVPTIPTKEIGESKKNSSKNSSSSLKPSKPSQPQIPLWLPKDKLPKDVAGHGLYGNFVIRGEDINGGAEIIAAEDAANPFARVFTIVNLSSGMAPGTLVPISQRRLVQVPKNKPLIFVGRGILPGLYNVQAR
jgi:hypothetical protein